MATWDDVRRLALALPETSERESRGSSQWRVKDKLFVWERPLRKSDLEALADSAPDGPILGARVEHLDRPAMGHSIDAESMAAAVAFLGRPLGPR